MSGSPVYSISKGLLVSPSQKRLLADFKENPDDALSALSANDFERTTNVLRFVGIYSGALAESGMRDLNLGFCWHHFLLDQIFKDLEPGHNPEPPMKFPPKSTAQATFSISTKFKM